MFAAQHSTAQHSTAQHSTAQPDFLSFRDARGFLDIGKKACLVKKISCLFMTVLILAAVMLTGNKALAANSYLTFTGTDPFTIKTNNSTKNWGGYA